MSAIKSFFGNTFFMNGTEGIILFAICVVAVVLTLAAIALTIVVAVAVSRRRREAVGAVPARTGGALTEQAPEAEETAAQAEICDAEQQPAGYDAQAEQPAEHEMQAETEQSEGQAEQAKTERPIVTVPASALLFEGDGVLYNKSFTAKLIQSCDEVKAWYAKLKNQLLSYKKVKARMSWKRETFRMGRIKVARFRYRGNTLCIYLPLDPASYAESKYKVEDVSEYSTYADTPCMYRLKNERRVRYAAELIAAVMSARGIERKERAEEDFYLPYEDTEALIEKGLIKRIYVESEDTAPQDISDEAATEVAEEAATEVVEEVSEKTVAEAVSEVAEEPSDENVAPVEEGEVAFEEEEAEEVVEEEAVEEEVVEEEVVEVETASEEVSAEEFAEEEEIGEPVAEDETEEVAAEESAVEDEAKEESVADAAGEEAVEESEETPEVEAESVAEDMPEAEEENLAFEEEPEQEPEQVAETEQANETREAPVNETESEAPAGEEETVEEEKYDENGIEVVGVMFRRRSKKVYWFDPDGKEWEIGETALYATSDKDSQEVVVVKKTKLSPDKLHLPLKPLRKANRDPQTETPQVQIKDEKRLKRRDRKAKKN